MNDDIGLGKEDKYVDLRDDPPEMVEKEVQDLIVGANANTLSNKGAKNLNTIIDEQNAQYGKYDK